jgi:hypothetical protein
VAPEEILSALPGMNAAMAAKIMEVRSLAEFRGVEDIQTIIGDSYSQMAPFIVLSQEGGSPSSYTVEAAGYKEDKKKGYGIMATISFDGPQKYHYVYYKSPAELSP